MAHTHLPSWLSTRPRVTTENRAPTYITSSALPKQPCSLLRFDFFCLLYIQSYPTLFPSRLARVVLFLAVLFFRSFRHSFSRALHPVVFPCQLCLFILHLSFIYHPPSGWISTQYRSASWSPQTQACCGRGTAAEMASASRAGCRRLRQHAASSSPFSFPTRLL